MNLGTRLVQDWKRKALGAGIIAALGLVVWVLPFTQGLARFSYDLPFVFRSDIKPDEVVIIYMDDKSRTQLKQPVQGPWDRALHVRLLKELINQHARVVAFDILFDEPWPDKSVDELFATAMKQHGKVILGASCEYAQTESGAVVGNLRQATEPLNSAASLGVAELPVDPDGVLRRHFYDDQYTNLAWQVATILDKAPGNRETPKWINYYGPRGAIRHVSYGDVIVETNLPPNSFSNQIVFIGMAPIINYQGSHSSDEHPTPYSKWTGNNSPGVEIQATAALNLIRKDWLVRLPRIMEICMSILFAFGLGFLTPHFRLRTSLLLSISVAAALFIGSVLMQQNLHLWSNWAVIPFVQLPVGIVWMAWFNASKRKGTPVEVAASSQADDFTSEGVPIIPEHVMLQKFGEGSYGQVWLAQNSLGTYRAVKVVFRKNFESDAPFDREFRGMQIFEPVSRSHEGFVDILQVGKRDRGGYFYYIMELADDQNLGQAIQPEVYSAKTLSSELRKAGQIPCTECVGIGVLLAGALQQLHSAGLVHRDIKPSNIIFVNGVPKLADIGLVAALNEARSFVGTEGFIPPEGPGQPQADIYSVGKVLYEMAMGRDRRHFPELPTTLAESPDREALIAMNEIILKACNDNPARRYATAEKMQTELKRLANRMKNRKTPPPE